MIRLLTEGGIPFEAMQRYAPISDRVTFASFRNSPWKVLTESKTF